MQGKLRHAPKLAHGPLQERRKTIRGCLHRFCLNAPLKGQAVHPYYSRQLQPPPHGHAMCQRPRHWRSPRTLPVLSSSPQDSPHCLLRPRNPLHWWGLQGILWPNLDHPGTSLPVVTTKLGEHWEATPDLKKRPLHDLRRQKLWMDGRSRIDSFLNECHSQHRHWCIPALSPAANQTLVYRRSPAKTSLTTTQVLTVCR